MMALARSEPELSARPQDFDHDPWLLNVANGTIDLRDGELRKHRQSDMITMLTDVEYKPDASANEFTRFLEQVIPDADVRDWTQRYLGYCLTGLVTEQKFAFWVGKGGNGKNVCADVVTATLGEYAMVGAPDLLLEKHGEAHPTELADIEGKRLVVCSEIEPGRSWAEARIKQITGDKTIKARRMKQDFYEFAASGKLVVLANTKPKVRSRDNGLWRRMSLQPWTVQVPQHEQDKQLLSRLIANERPGVLAWLVRGCLAWHNRGLADPRAIVLATSEYRKQEDVIGMWIADCCRLDPSAWQETTKLYESYKSWCKDAGNDRPWSLKAWMGELVERPGIARRSNGYSRGLEGIRLLGIGELPDNE
jgi:putative DNA primase/helicase